MYAKRDLIAAAGLLQAVLSFSAPAYNVIAAKIGKRIQYYFIKTGRSLA